MEDREWKMEDSNHVADHPQSSILYPRPKKLVARQGNAPCSTD